MSMSARRSSTMTSFLPPKVPQNSMATDIGASVRYIPHTIIIFDLEDKIQDPGEFLFRFSLGGYVMDQRKWRWSIQWMTLKSSRSFEGKDVPTFDMLDARIASALNKIIQNYFKKKVSLEELKAEKEDRFVRKRQIAYIIYDYFRVTGAHDTVLDCADLFSIGLRNDDVQEFDTRWDEILLSMTKVPSG